MLSSLLQTVKALAPSKPKPRLPPTYLQSLRTAADALSKTHPDTKTIILALQSSQRILKAELEVVNPAG